MHPIVPIIMTLGGILFSIGVIVFTWLGVKRINVIKLRGREYKLWQFVSIMVGSGTTLIMVSVLIPKYISYQPEQGTQPIQQALSSNLKYELDIALNGLNLTGDVMKSAIDRFRQEYQAAAQKNEKNTMDLLILELGFRIKTELQNQGYSENQIEREKERIISILKQSSKQENGK